MESILAKRGKALLLGNEAIVRGALEAGVAVAATYPGTPASEIGDTFAKIAKKAGIYFEYSTNEKVAFEVAAGAALCGLRALVSFKHYGLNVALDSIVSVPYLDVGGLVIVVSDDAGASSSVQAEEDTRLFARIAHIPLLEPSNASEAKEMTKYAFELSEKFKVPVLLRLTTAVSHTAELIRLGKINKYAISDIEKIIKRVKASKIFSYAEKHTELHKKLEQINDVSEKSKLNFTKFRKKSDVAIICSGVSYNYVLEALDAMAVSVPLLKIGFSWPLPRKKIEKFIQETNASKILVLEEVEPILENEIKNICKAEVHGKDWLGFSAYRPEEVFNAISKILGLKEIVRETIKVPKRNPALCPGCPHRASYWAVKKALAILGEDWKNKIYSGDIGCYLLGMHKPIEMQDFFVSMGSSLGIAEGINKAIKNKQIAFIGDSTFLHAGIAALINAVYNKNNLLLIILDNGTTAMTGHQPHPGTGITGMQEPTKAISLEEIARACVGIANVKVVNVFNVSEFIDAVKKFYVQEGVSVIIARGKCRLLFVRELARKEVKLPKAEIFDENEVKKCLKELEEFGCPAIRKAKKLYIDKNLCWGCGVCSQICKGIKMQAT